MPLSCWRALPKMPCLPQLDPSPDARAASLARERERYQFDFSNHNIGFAKSVPISQHLSAEYVAAAIALQAQLKANKALATLAMAKHAGQLSPRAAARDALHRMRDGVLDALYAPKRDPKRTHYRARPPEPLSAYRDVFQCIPAPRVVNGWKDDLEHAWQRIAGVGPVVIERSQPGLLDRIGVTEAMYQRAVGGGDSLEAAMAEGRLFECHYDILEGIDPGETDGLRHFLSAPVGLYVVPKGGPTKERPLLPVCIQTTPRPSAKSMFAPGDGWGWEMAKATLQSSDDNFHGVVEHLGRCHVLVLQFAIATNRALDASHPVRVLLEPNFENTFPTVDEGTQPLILPGGRTPRLQSVSVRGAIDLLKKSLETFRWNAGHPPNVFADKGVLSNDVLGVYPYRDDSMPLWDAIGSFVERYLRLYYASDADVVADMELAGWMRELTSEEGARIRDIGEDGTLRTFAGLKRLVTQAIWRITAYHNVINYSVYDMMAFPPNLATAQFAPPPIAGHTYDEGDFRAMLAPIDLVFEILDDVWVVSNLQTNRLGGYCPTTFIDGRVWPIVTEFQQTLEDIEVKTRARDAERRASYWYLFPSKIAASIQV